MGEFVSTLGNPWLATEFNVTKQGQFFVKYGARRAEQFAEIARRQNELMRAPVEARTYLMTKRPVIQIVGAGSAGDVDPTP